MFELSPSNHLRREEVSLGIRRVTGDDDLAVFEPTMPNARVTNQMFCSSYQQLIRHLPDFVIIQDLFLVNCPAR